MYCFQDGSEVISIKHEATDTQQEQENSAVAITFTEIKAEEEVSCVYLYPLLFIFSNTLCCQKSSALLTVNAACHFNHTEQNLQQSGCNEVLYR